MPDQGCGELCTLPDKSNTYLYAYYVDHSRVNNRGVQICMARSKISEGPPLPGTWKKYYKGKFREKGLKGLDTPVLSARNMHADAAFPHVSFSTLLNKYVMVFNINAYMEYVNKKQNMKPEKSGIYMAFSDDAVLWSKPRQLITIFSIPVRNRELGWHPALIWDSDKSSEAWLVYSFTPSWGHEHLKGIPHHMAGQRMKFSITR